MLSRYYRLRGWDDNGVPTPETLRRLELDKWT
jgi:aldehyde:ferredoxin oxidoreductase